jgi:predicted RNA polymerase sigma factor
MLAPLAEDLNRYRPYHSVRAALLEDSGNFGAAIAALEAALSCESTRQETAYLKGKIVTLKENLGILSD